MFTSAHELHRTTPLEPLSRPWLNKKPTSPVQNPARQSAPLQNWMDSKPHYQPCIRRDSLRLRGIHQISWTLPKKESLRVCWSSGLQLCFPLRSCPSDSDGSGCAIPDRRISDRRHRECLPGWKNPRRHRREGQESSGRNDGARRKKMIEIDPGCGSCTLEGD